MNSCTAILINPRAGGGRATKLELPIQNWVRAHNLHIKEIYIARQLADTLNWVSKRPFKSRLIVVGGDGTVSQLLPTLLHLQLELALIPYGSGNDCARELGIQQLDWCRSLELATESACRSMDVGLASYFVEGKEFHRPFLSSFSCGFDAEVAQMAVDGPSFLTGQLRYLYATLRTILSLKLVPIAISNQEKLIYQGKTLLASSLNTKTFGGGLPAAPHGSAFDREIDLLVAGDINKLKILKLLPLLGLGKHLQQQQVFSYRYQKLSIHSQKKFPIASDGEFLGFTNQLELQLSEQVLHVVSHQHKPRGLTDRSLHPQ